MTLTLTLGLMIAGCGTDSQTSEDGVLVVATTSIIADIASNVVGDDGVVEFLIPLGSDSHDFSPSAQQAARLAEADLVVANGLGLEESMMQVLESAKTDGAAIVELAPLVDPIPFAGPEDEEADHEDHGRDDPHFWMDPARVGSAAIALAETLTANYPDEGWLSRAEAYAREMEATDAAIREMVEDLPEQSRKIVTNHEAFGYFAHRYGFEVVGVVIPGGSTLAEPSSAELAELVDVMRQEGVRVIFGETSHPTNLADAVAAELGEDVAVIQLFTESLGPAGSEAETLSELLLVNTRRIVAAFG
ncbi:MAG TPA: metal ABC transporter substrate-binding protein [Acidimicrobiia bacterium]|nr:metal ABC transporter substrate-binding protein [Acidimicrobiia bacterium]